jgi:uncharacterized protein (DUF885 family)
MQHDPWFATSCGDHRYDDHLPGADEEYIMGWLEQLKGFRAQATEINRHLLDKNGQLNFDIFTRFLDYEIREICLRGYHLPISKSGGFHIGFPDLFLLMPFRTTHDYENYIARLADFQRYCRDYIGLMRRGLQEGYCPARPTLDGVDESLQAQIVEDAVQSVLYKPFEDIPEVIEESDRERLRAEGRVAILKSVVPGYRELMKFVQGEYRSYSRESVGASELPQGREFYAHRIEYFTTMPLSANDVHQTGLDEVQRIRSEMESVMVKANFKGGFRNFIQYLRTELRFYAKTPDELLKETAFILKRMDGELPRLFNTLPRLPYGIRPIPDFSAPGNTTAYYFPGAPDGTRAGMYYVNTYDLPSRPLYEIEALSLHEAVPGHHLQIALQQELDLPNFRRHAGFTSFVEGWALYAERLGLEVGFYTDPYSDFGRLSYEMWRACRLVVDTGMHALGWTRQRAIDFMVENTSSTLLNIANEVDRYIAWPGQALAYKIGEIKIRQLRALAEKELGQSFDVRQFHDVLLLEGAAPLDVVEERVKEWVEANRGGKYV